MKLGISFPSDREGGVRITGRVPGASGTGPGLSSALGPPLLGVSHRSSRMLVYGLWQMTDGLIPSHPPRKGQSSLLILQLS